MPYLRYQIDLAFKRPISPILQGILTDFRKELMRLKPYAERINAGGMNEEDTQKGEKHICKHDEGLPCEPREDLTLTSIKQ